MVEPTPIVAVAGPTTAMVAGPIPTTGSTKSTVQSTSTLAYVIGLDACSDACFDAASSPA